jgi:hypothetical protein
MFARNGLSGCRCIKIAGTCNEFEMMRGKPDLRWSAICPGVDLVIPFRQVVDVEATLMTVNQAVAMAFPIFTGGAVLLSLYAVKRWVQSQRTATKETEPDDGSSSAERRTIQAISDNLGMAQRIIQQAQRDLTNAQ